MYSASMKSLHGGFAGESDGYLRIYALPCEELRMATLPENSRGIGNDVFCKCEKPSMATLLESQTGIGGFTFCRARSCVWRRCQRVRRVSVDMHSAGVKSQAWRLCRRVLTNIDGFAFC